MAVLRGQEVLFYRNYGNNQGNWVLIAKDENRVFIYRGNYGDCAYCDDFGEILTQQREAWRMTRGEKVVYSDDGFYEYSGNGVMRIREDHPQLRRLLEMYPPYKETTFGEIIELGRENRLEEIIPIKDQPYHLRDNVEQVLRQLLLQAKIYTGQDLELLDYLEIDNTERRRELLEEYGMKKFIEDIKPEILDEQGGDYLMRIKKKPVDFVFLFLKDASTDRQYLERVPPHMTKVSEARAWQWVGIRDDIFRRET